jgi:hypothetical protein
MSKFGNAGETTAVLRSVYLEAPQLQDWEHPLFASRYTQDTTYFRVRISASSESATRNAGPYDGPSPLSSGRNQLRIGQRGLVLVVSEVCDRGDGVGRASG